MFKGLAAAVAATMLATPASATVYNLSADVDATTLFSPVLTPASYLFGTADFSGVALVAGDTLNLGGALSPAVAYLREPAPFFTHFYLALEALPSGCAPSCVKGGLSFISQQSALSAVVLPVAFQLAGGFVTGYAAQLAMPVEADFALTVTGVRFQTSGVPELATWALTLIGAMAAALAAAARRSAAQFQ